MDTLEQIFNQLALAGHDTLVNDSVCYFKSKEKSDLISYMTLEVSYNGLGFPKHLALRVYSTRPWCEEMEQDLLTKPLFYDIQFASFETIADLIQIIKQIEKAANKHITDRLVEYELQKKQLTLF